MIRVPERVVRTWRQRFYPALALAFTVLVVCDGLFWHVATEMRQAAFDLLVRNRLRVPPPDPGIVLVDIDEASLSAMAVDHGRWPWPRQVFGEFLEGIEAQKPRAVVFDMLFADADLFLPESDSYFVEAVARSESSFFPILRLDPAADGLSRFSPASLPGVRPLRPDAETAATIAVVLPAFDAVLATGRIGLNNIYPDPDGVAREYTVHLEHHGWAIPSLPARVAEFLGYPNPGFDRILLNWRGPPFSYRTISFADVFADLGRRERTRPPDEFTGKIVIVGSTASSLFDAKPTPVGRIHPGVEILATAVDNLLHGDFLVPLSGARVHMAGTLLILWATALAFTWNVGRERIDALFSASGLLLVGISFASLNLTRYVIDLTGPVSIGLAYFSLARVYAVSADRILETSALRRSREADADHRAVLLLVDLGGIRRATSQRILGRVRRSLAKGDGITRSAELLKGDQEGFWSICESMLAVSWVVASGREDGHDRAMEEAVAISSQVRQALPPADASSATFVIREGAIAGGSRAAASWRALFAEALLAPREVRPGTDHP